MKPFQNGEKNNRERFNKYNKEYFREKYANDIPFIKLAKKFT